MRTDEDLMIDYRDGDRSAFDQLVRRHWAGVAGLLRRLLRDESLVDDALIEVFFKLHRAASSYRPQGRFSTFLFRIAYREAIDTLRAARGPRQRVVVPFTEPSGLEREIPCARPDSEAHVLAREDLQLLDALLETLDEIPRAVFLLYYREELPTPEIAEVLEIPVSSVRVYLSLARKALREALETLDASERTVATRR